MCILLRTYVRKFIQNYNYIHVSVLFCCVCSVVGVSSAPSPRSVFFARPPVSTAECLNLLPAQSHAARAPWQQPAQFQASCDCSA